jgi:hypothetical protein
MRNKNITNQNDIVLGMHLDMQREDDTKHGYFYWGIVEEKDISKLKRQIKKGSYLWRKSILDKESEKCSVDMELIHVAKMKR